MAHVTKAGTVIPSQFDRLVMPLITAFAAITDTAAVAALREMIRDVKLPQETDEFAHLRLRGTVTDLDRLCSGAKKAGACDEFVELLRRLRQAVARAHDALPPNPGYTRSLLASPEPGSVAPWAALAVAEPAEPPVRNENAEKLDYLSMLQD